MRYVELHCKTNFSFLEGASHAEELVERAIELGYAALAVTVPAGDHTVFAVLERDSRAVVGNFQLPRGAHVAEFWWANPRRVLIAIAERFGSRDYPSPTGELYAMNVDGSDVRRVTDRIGYDGGAFFSPDGSKIVWRAQYPETAADTADYLDLLSQRLVRPSQLEVWVANADGSEPRRVTDLSAASFAPSFRSSTPCLTS